MAQANDSCQLTIDQLNGKILTNIAKDICDGCFFYDVRLQIQSDNQQITYLRLLGTSYEQKIYTFKPYTQSLVINEDFKIIDQTSGSPYNFIQYCLANRVNGLLTYKVLFRVKVNGANQFFELNNGYSQGILLKLSIIMLSIMFLLV